MSRNGPSPRYAPSAIGGLGFSSFMPNILEKKVNNSPTPQISSGHSNVLAGLTQKNTAWEGNQPKALKVERKTEDELTKSMTNLAVCTASKANSTVPEWRRELSVLEKHSPKPAGSRAQNGSLKKSGLFGRTLVSTASKASCTFTRSYNQPPMHKKEFALGTIIRGVIHEQDIMNTPKPTPFDAPTAITNAGKQHITHGDFGPVYSENRFLIVVNNRPENHYLAIPVYSHKGNGLSKKLNRDEYVSVADHRYLANCQQQSAHAPLVTEVLKEGLEELLPMSVAYVSYPVSRKYGLPVAYQGRLDEESTNRLVAMYLNWGRPCDDRR